MSISSQKNGKSLEELLAEVAEGMMETVKFVVTTANQDVCGSNNVGLESHSVNTLASSSFVDQIPYNTDPNNLALVNPSLNLSANNSCSTITFPTPSHPTPAAYTSSNSSDFSLNLSQPPSHVDNPNLFNSLHVSTTSNNTSGVLILSYDNSNATADIYAAGYGYMPITDTFSGQHQQHRDSLPNASVSN